MNNLKELQELSNRFHGIDLQHRRSGTNWPHPWRARLRATKNERAEYRIEAFGNTAEEAISDLIDRANNMSIEQRAMADNETRINGTTPTPASLPGWKKTTACLPEIEQIVAVCIDGKPQFIAFKRVKRGHEKIHDCEIHGEHEPDSWRDHAEQIDRLRKFIDENGWAWSEVEGAHLLPDFEPSHWIEWFEAPNSNK